MSLDTLAVRRYIKINTKLNCRGLLRVELVLIFVCQRAVFSRDSFGRVYAVLLFATVRRSKAEKRVKRLEIVEKEAYEEYYSLIVCWLFVGFAFLFRHFGAWSFDGLCSANLQ
jgi:hypothetical protein